MDIKKAIVTLVAAIFFLPTLSFAETIILKSGHEITGEIIEKTQDYIRIDLEGVPLTYYSNEIQSIAEERSDTSPLTANYSPEPENNALPQSLNPSEDNFQNANIDTAGQEIQNFAHNNKTTGIPDYNLKEVKQEQDRQIKNNLRTLDDADFTGDLHGYYQSIDHSGGLTKQSIDKYNNDLSDYGRNLDYNSQRMRTELERYTNDLERLRY
jgi:hypothetical protein